jgi:hypothetical protein
LASSRLGQLSPATLAVLAGVALPLVFYFAARMPAPVLPAHLDPPPGTREAARLALLPLELGVARFAREWARFLGFELLPLVAALAGMMALARRGARGSGRFGARLLLAATAVLALVPVIAFGFFNDWAMRASIPPLFALQVLQARALSSARAPLAARRGFAALLLVAGLYPLSQLRLQAAQCIERGEWVWVFPRTHVRNLFVQQRDGAGYGFVEQYVARADAPFFRLLAPPLTARRTVPATSRPRAQAPRTPAP